MYKKPSNREFKKVFDSVAKNYDKVLNQYAIERRIEFIEKYAEGDCLEVGAGNGEISKHLIDKNHKVVATDISQKMVKVIKEKLKIKAYVCDAEKLPFDNNSFDTVVAAEVIYYLDHPEKFIKEARRVLRKNGSLIISSASKITEYYDDVRSLLRKIGISSMYFNDPNREFMSLNLLKKLLTEGGFRIKKSQMAIIIPFKLFDQLNHFFEKTPLRIFSSFIFIYAQK